MQPNDFNSLQQGMNGMSLSGSNPSLNSSQSNSSRVNYYASPEEGPPNKLSVTHPDVSFHPLLSFAALLPNAEPIDDLFPRAAKNVGIDERRSSCEWWGRVKEGRMGETSSKIHRTNTSMLSLP
jgi:hypothetical protein